MLTELRVRDLGVIVDLSLTFGPAMTAITGETGAGKTLLVEAIELLTGGRSDPALVRPGADEAIIEGRFVIGDEERTFCRVVSVSGRSRAYVDGRMASVSALAEETDALVDLHGQHAHQSLLRASGQRAALDAFAGVDLAPLRAARARVTEIRAALEGLGGDLRTRAREIDLLRFQLAEIDGAAITSSAEDEELAAEQDLLSEASAHREAAASAHELLVSDDGLLDRLGAAVALLDARQPLLPLAERLRAVAAEMGDLASELRSAEESLVDDPERLAWVTSRRQTLSDLRRKYGDTLEAVLDFGQVSRERLAELEDHDAAAARLEAGLDEARAAVRAHEAEVGAARRRSGPKLARQVEEHLGELAMRGARIAIEVGEADPGEEVTFLLAANRGSPLLPLAKVASGGELARAMLAARMVLSDGPPVMVFDEVDAGVGGQAAVAVGRALAALGSCHQVLVVTHLAQVAAFADHQVAVRKGETGATTVTSAELLDGAGRVIELSRMLGGQPESAQARGHAEELLALGRRTATGGTATGAGQVDGRAANPGAVPRARPARRG